MISEPLIYVRLKSIELCPQVAGFHREQLQLHVCVLPLVRLRLSAGIGTSTTALYRSSRLQLGHIGAYALAETVGRERILPDMRYLRGLGGRRSPHRGFITQTVHCCMATWSLLGIRHARPHGRILVSSHERRTARKESVASGVWIVRYGLWGLDTYEGEGP